MPYRYVDNVTVADVAVEAVGCTISEVFAAAATAMTAVLVENVKTVHRNVNRIVELSNDQLDLLMFEWLEELVFLKDARGLLLLPVSVAVDRGTSREPWGLRARVAGESIDRQRHVMEADVKAVALHRLHVFPQAGTGWLARFVLDV